MPMTEHVIAVDRVSKDGLDRIELVAGKGWRVVSRGHPYESVWTKKNAAIALWKLQKQRKAKAAKRDEQKPQPTRHERLMRDDDPLDQALGT